MIVRYINVELLLLYYTLITLLGLLTEIFFNIQNQKQ